MLAMNWHQIIAVSLSHRVIPILLPIIQNIDLVISNDQEINITVRDLVGRELSRLTLSLQKGAHSFTIYPGNENIYLLTICGERASKTLKLLNAGSGSTHTSHCTIVHNTDHEKEYIFKTTTFNGFTFNLGDLLRYTGYAIALNNNPGSDTLEDTPLVSTFYEFEIIGEVVLPTVITDTVLNVTNIDALIRSEVTSDGGDSVTARGVCWSISPDPTLADDHTSNGSGTGIFMSYIAGLTANTLYYVRSYATNSVGTAYGNEITFTTLEDPVLPTVTTDTATNITQTTATSGGEVTSDGGAYVTVRGVCWSTSPNPTTSDDHTEDGSGIGTFVSNLTGLTANTLYYVRAYATNSLGTAYGNEIDFTTTAFVCGDDQIADIDGNSYNTVEIGSQCWMKENLKTTKYNNNTPIPNVTDPTTWSNLITGAYVWYNNDSTWKDSYGALYNWYTTVDTNNLCPTGWHVPSHDEWTDLTNFIGGTSNGNQLKSCRQVNSPLGGGCNTSEHPRWKESSAAYGTDDYGFSALPGGKRGWSDGWFYNVGSQGFWWSSTEKYPNTAWCRYLDSSNGHVPLPAYHKRYGYSVRCLRD